MWVSTVRLLAALWLAVAAVVAHGQTQAVASATGLELTDPASVQLVIDIGRHAEKYGLTQQQVRLRLDPALQKAGLKPLAGPAEGRLELRIDSDSTGAFFTVAVDFVRNVQFTAGTLKFSHPATVWSRSIHGSFNQNAGIVVLTVGQFVDEFMAAFLKANPRPDLKGKIMASDPRYQFVVVSVGADQGVKEDIELAVQREGKTIAIVRVVRVNKDHCIANVLQDPKPPELFEGDMVVPRR